MDVKKKKFQLADTDQYRLDDAYGRLEQAKEYLGLVQENINLKARNAELEAWYAEYAQAGHDRLASDLNLSIALCKSQLPTA